MFTKNCVSIFKSFVFLTSISFFLIPGQAHAAYMRCVGGDSAFTCCGWGGISGGSCYERCTSNGAHYSNPVNFVSFITCPAI